MTNSMSYKGYTANMVFDAEDKVVVGRVQDIDEIISFHGESVSVSEFEATFHAATEGYLAAPQGTRFGTREAGQRQGHAAHRSGGSRRSARGCCDKWHQRNVSMTLQHHLS